MYDLDDSQDPRLHSYVLEVLPSGLWLRDSTMSLEEPSLAATARAVRLLPREAGVVNVVTAADGRLGGARSLATQLGPAATVELLTAEGYRAALVSPVDVSSTAADPKVRSGLTSEQQRRLDGQRARYRVTTEDLYRLDGRPPEVVSRDGLLPRREALE